MFAKIKNKIKSIRGKVTTWFSLHPTVMALVLAFSVAFANELMSRRSLIKTVVFVFTKPLLFLCNMAIVMIFESLALIFKKRSYMLTLFSLLLLSLGITNFVVGFFRQTPFSSMDFVLVTSVFPILIVYLTGLGLIAVGAFLLALIVFLIVLWVKAKKTPVKRLGATVTLFSSGLAAFLLIGLGIRFGLIPSHFSNLQNAYRDYGFTYCFAATLVDRGIDKPELYDDEIQGIISEILSNETDETTDVPSTDGETSSDNPAVEPEQSTPNIIFVQLESFYDLNYLEGFEFKENPIPIFTELKENYTGGLLTVPSVGAGTANTEFEVLSGMSLKWFGAGEYPYETVLQKRTCETVCYNLASLGYTSHAIHNYKGNFYDRRDVFGNLGFNTFTPIEYMNGIKTNMLGWAEDKVLNKYVMSALESTDGSDLVYCITVQGHGKYPTGDLGEDAPPSLIEKLPEEANINSFSYFADQLHQTDEFIGGLISSVEALGEETVIVFFGDHIPNIGIKEEWLPDGMTPYDTEYVIWSNFETEREDEDIYSYQLSAKVLSMLGIDEGVLTKLHQTWRNREIYETYLEMLEYDILYGECFAYGGENPFLPTDLQLGVNKIEISSVSVKGDSSYILGANFTESSKIFLNGIMRSTEFIDENTLILEDITLENGDTIKIVQISDKIFHVGETDDYEVVGIK
ncbi:MAG: sulfatase-like hydrolase/transferase [Clostridia bacterium]|nr:sulfatase-like hydrolase/transferase [Clostridia bacterium]